MPALLFDDLTPLAERSFAQKPGFATETKLTLPAGNPQKMIFAEIVVKRGLLEKTRSGR
jgi:hypothetical protein